MIGVSLHGFPLHTSDRFPETASATVPRVAVIEYLFWRGDARSDGMGFDKNADSNVLKPFQCVSRIAPVGKHVVKKGVKLPMPDPGQVEKVKHEGNGGHDKQKKNIWVVTDFGL